MNILLLGNGFDLNHKFPTRYLDFLYTVNFLVENYDNSMSTVEKVFGNEELQKKDKMILECYETHKFIYHKTALSQSNIDELIQKAKNNVWFKYFSEVLDKDVGWIDFEREIGRIIEVFYYYFDSIGKQISNINDAKIMHMLEKFSFFIVNKDDTICSFWDVDEVQEQYTYEYPIGSGYYEIDKEKIISSLYDMLFELSEMLNLYLQCFVDQPAMIMKKAGRYAHSNSYPSSVYKAFSFNYTNTYELLSETTAEVIHIHGKNEKRIVLGVNPDQRDELPTIDTSFIKFKKYYQRIIFGTDVDYQHAVRDVLTQKKYGSITLYVIGHSLDCTDKDIITDLFNLSDRIIILYYKQDALESMTKNLTEIFGKTNFDAIRVSKQLMFLKQGEVEWKVNYTYPQINP